MADDGSVNTHQGEVEGGAADEEVWTILIEFIKQIKSGQRCTRDSCLTV